MLQSKRPLTENGLLRSMRETGARCRLRAGPVTHAVSGVRPAYGFTLIELMVTIAILAILLSIGVPGFQSFVQNSRATTLANQLTTTINLARSEAVRRGTVVSVCADVWTEGWRVEMGPDCNATGDDILRIWEALPTGSVIDSGGADSVGFEAAGARADLDGNPVVFRVRVANCRGLRARVLRVSPNGSVGVEREDCP